MSIETKTGYIILTPRKWSVSNIAIPLRPRPTMLPTKAYDRFSPPPTIIPSQSPRLCYFISRSNGTFVPLIPADELPYSVRLAGVPRAMKIEHSCGMSHVGTHAFTGQLFQLEPADAAQHIIDRINTSHINPSSSKQRPAASDPILYQSEQGRPDTRSPPRSEPSAPQQLPISATTTNWRRVDDAASAKSQKNIDNIIAQGSHSPAHKPETAVRVSRTSSSSPKSSYEQKDKVYCSYWIRSGECDYTQQGCRYKHEMPDKATLASIGFRTVPRWWQKKVAIQLGQSAIPTVGPVIKPAEWLKQRRDSQGSQSDEESESEHESEAGDEKSSGGDAAPTSAVEQSETVLDPTEANLEQDAASELEKIGGSSENAATQDSAIATAEREKIDDSFNKAAKQVSSISTHELVNEPNRKLSDVDLIDLSPITPTETISCKSNDPTTFSPIPSTEPCPNKTPPPSLPTVASPRKVFVPAGESTEFHVADARKHAQSQKSEPKESSTEQCEAEESAAEKHSPTTPITTSKPSEAKSGLMASMHAPKPTSGRPPNNDGSSSARKPQRQPKANSSPSPKPKAADTKKRATMPSNRSQLASQKVGTASPTTQKAVTINNQGVSPKSIQSTGTDSPKRVCRPRRPAASNAKVVASRAVTGGTRE